MNSKSQDYEIGQKQYLITARNTIAYTQQETKLLFFSHLFPVRQRKEIWNNFMVMKTRFIIPIYQSI